jgi:predicted dehydrogenase
MARPPVRIAVVGAGSIGRRHVEYIRKDEGCDLFAVVDPAPAARTLAESLGVAGHESLDQMFRCGRPDGVLISTPNKLHFEQALRCAAERVPMLIEKPLADTVEKGLRICEAAEAAGVPVLVGHHRRHSAIIARATEVIATGVLGRLVTFTGSALFYKSEAEGYFDGANAWRREPGGGPILINMIHEIDNMRALCGEIAAVQAFSSAATRGFAVEDTSAILLRFANGALGTFVLSDTAASNRSWEHTSGEDARYAPAHTDEDDCYLVTGTMGSLAIPTMRLIRYTSIPDRSWRKPFERSVLPLATVDPLARQIAHFRDVIRGDVAPRVSGRDGLQNVRIVEAIVEAARAGMVVETSSTGHTDPPAHPEGGQA